MDILFDSIGRFIFEILKLIIRDLIIDIIVYGLGYITLKIVTLGFYPKKDRSNDHAIYISGTISIILIIIAFGLINN